jgi:hypothetical protein
MFKRVSERLMRIERDLGQGQTNPAEKKTLKDERLWLRNK